MSIVQMISIVGKSNVGKTTLLEKLLPELKSRGYRVATIKHDVHGFEVDQPGKDSWRHAQAGSDISVISSPNKLAMIRKVDEDTSLEEISRIIGTDVDLIMTEGYKRGNAPKIEVHRKEVAHELLCTAEELIAIATDEALPIDVPQFDLDDAKGLVDSIEKKILSKQEYNGVDLWVNGQKLTLKPFIHEMLVNAVSGMVEALRGAETAENIELRIRKISPK